MRTIEVKAGRGHRRDEKSGSVVCGLSRGQGQRASWPAVLRIKQQFKPRPWPCRSVRLHQRPEQSQVHPLLRPVCACGVLASQACGVLTARVLASREKKCLMRRAPSWACEFSVRNEDRVTVADPSNSKMCYQAGTATAQCELTKMHRRSACDPALESSRQRRQGELSQASIEV